MGKQLIINIDGTDYTVQLDESVMADEFTAMAPFKTSVYAYASNHYWGAIPRKITLDEQYQTSNPQKGGLYYADHTTALAIFYDKSGSIAPYKIYHIGEIVGDMLGLMELPYQVKCLVKAVE